MRKVIVLEHISLDGVIQAPGGPDENTSGGLAYGGWITPYSDAILGTALNSIAVETSKKPAGWLRLP